MFTNLKIHFEFFSNYWKKLKLSKPDNSICCIQTKILLLFKIEFTSFYRVVSFSQEKNFFFWRKISPPVIYDTMCRWSLRDLEFFLPLLKLGQLDKRLERSFLKIAHEQPWGKGTLFDKCDIRSLPAKWRKMMFTFDFVPRYRAVNIHEKTFFFHFDLFFLANVDVLSLFM